MRDLESSRATRVVTFFAYKGGTGRTLAAANVARYLAEVRGYRVGMIDLDVSSAGLSDHPLTSLHSGTREERIREAKGFVSLYLKLEKAYLSHGESLREQLRSSGRLKGALDRSLADRAEDHRTLLPLLFEQMGTNLEEHAANLTCPGHRGELYLIPSAVHSLEKDHDYVRDLEAFHSHAGPSRTPDQSRMERRALLRFVVEEFARTCALDFVFLDGRTGYAPFHEAYAADATHLLVAFTGLNQQNQSGVLSLFDRKGDRPDPSPTLLVVSPVPATSPLAVEDRMQKLLAQIEQLKANRRSGGAWAYGLPRSIHTLPYTDVASTEEQYFIGEYPSSRLAEEYLSLAKVIEAFEVGGEVRVHPADSKRAALAALSRTEIRIAAETISYHALKWFIESELGLRETSTGTTRDRGFQAEFRGADSKVVLDLFHATSDMAPWTARSPGAMPDIIVFPQSRIGGLAGLLNPFTQDRLLPNLSPDRLDEHYPGWRAWCFNGDHQWLAVPFSTNVPLLCLNRERALGWHRGSFPSNWESYWRLVSGSSQSAAFMAGHGRALYYEWMSHVLSYSGADVFLSEEGTPLGALEDALRSDGTRVGTEAFLHSAEVLAIRGGYHANASLDDAAAAFRRGETSVYLTWTDNFWEAKGHYPDALRLWSLPDDGDGSRSPGGVEVRLAEIPRGTAVAPRKLLANWVVGLPAGRKPSGGDSVLNHFLAQSVQQQLMARGFPTASLTVAKDQVARLHRERESSSDLALLTRVVRDALGGGQLVADVVPDWPEKVNAVLQDAIQATVNGADIGTARDQVLDSLRATLSGSID